MDETCRLRRGEGYEVCADEVVSKCALHREKRKAPVSRSPPHYIVFLASSYK